MLGRICYLGDEVYSDGIVFLDPNERNLVSEVSCKVSPHSRHVIYLVH